MKANPNIVKLTSLAAINKKIEFVYKIKNNNDFELKFEENVSPTVISNIIKLYKLGKFEMNVENNKVTILFNEELTNVLYLLKENYNKIWRR